MKNNSMSEKINKEVTKMTPDGNELKKIVEKIKESPGKKKIEMKEEKSVIGPNKQKFVSKKEQQEQSSK